jgi:hypothetical protein
MTVITRVVVAAALAVPWMALFGQQTPRLDDSAAKDLAGADGCWTLGVYLCGVATTCSTQGCTEGWFSWYCADGTREETPLPHYYCTATDEGREECYADQSVLQQCKSVRACSTSCDQSTLNGAYYCSGPTGPTYITFYFPDPYLAGDDCPPIVA